MDDKKIKLIYEDERLYLSANEKHNSLEVFENVALVMLRQMHKTKKGRGHLKRISTILKCWEV